MAADLSTSPVSGMPVVMAGDAHLNNFGMYGTPQREIVFDLNDFDEAIVGPWEWDLKRLVASVNVAGRQNGLNRRERATAVRRCVAGYRFNVKRLEGMGVLDTWYLHAYPGRDNPISKPDPKSRAVISKVLAKAQRTDNLSLLPKVAEVNGNRRWQFRDDPPVLTRVDPSTKKKIIAALNQYSQTLPTERRLMLGRYHVADVAHRVVGVGSVGTRAYLVLLFGNGDSDPLFLQVKESVEAAHAPYLPPLPPDFRHQGKRVLMGQRALQASSDPMLGYTSIEGRDYYVRQMKNLKASVPVEWLTGRRSTSTRGLAARSWHALIREPAIQRALPVTVETGACWMRHWQNGLRVTAIKRSVTTRRYSMLSSAEKFRPRRKDRKSSSVSGVLLDLPPLSPDSLLRRGPPGKEIGGSRRRDHPEGSEEEFRFRVGSLSLCRSWSHKNQKL